jgi:hypothetical protein
VITASVTFSPDNPRRIFDIGQDKRGNFRRAVKFAPQVDAHIAVFGALDLVRQTP